MRIVFLSPSGALGGAERSLLDVVASLSSARPGWRFHVVAMAPGPLLDRLAAIGVPSTLLPLPRSVARLGDAPLGAEEERRVGSGAVGAWSAGGVRAAEYALRLRRTLGMLAPDLVHTNGLKAHALGAMAAPGGTPVVWHVRDYLSGRPLASRILRLSAGRCAAVVANSRSVARDVRAVCGRRLAVTPVHNAVDLEVFRVDGPRLDLDESAGLAPAPPGTVRVGLVSTMAPWKGHDVFLRAMARLPRDPLVRAYVIGGPVYATDTRQWGVDELRRLAGELGVGDRVGFTGFLSDPATALRALDVVVHASVRPEPFGRVVAEAMACGRAVVASGAGGTLEIVTPGADALVHEPGDVMGLAACLEELIGDAGLRARLGAAARAAAEARFDSGRLAREVLAVYGVATGRPVA